MSRSFKESARSGAPNYLEMEVPEGPRSSRSSVYDTNGNTQPSTTRNHRKIRRVLTSRHIFMITISGVVGMGLFDNSGEILSIAGPRGGITAFVVVGLVVICIMDGIAEMIGHWPIANCMFEFVAKFVDKDLALVVGIAYWYCYSISFATLIIVAADLAKFWNWSTTLQDLIFTVGIMGLLIAINCLGVLWYARVESVLGFMKILLILGSFFTMIGIRIKDTHAEGFDGSSNIDDGFQHDPIVAGNNAIAVLVAIPIVAYAYCGVEIVAVTAVEAKNQRSLKFPANWIAWITTGAYILSVIGFYLNVSWSDTSLPKMEGNETTSNGTTTTPSNSTTLESTALVIIAALEARVPALPSILNMGLIIAVLSTSNTCLYVASRTLYGLTQNIDYRIPIWGRISMFSTTTTDRKIPAFALLASALTFSWVPFLRFSKSLTNQQLREIMSGIATVAVVIVWAALCGAFIRYRTWLKKHEKHLEDNYSEYNYWKTTNEKVPFRTVLGILQPYPAWIGLIFCVLIVFVFSTAGWWNGKAKVDAVASALLGPLILSVIWLALKFFRKRSGKKGWGFVKLGTWEQLQSSLDKLAASRDGDDGPTDQPTSQESMRSVGYLSGWISKFPNLPNWFGRTRLKPVPEPRPVYDSYRGNGSGNVSPYMGPTFQALSQHDADTIPDTIELSPTYGPAAGQTTVPDPYRNSISGSVSPRRKPVPSTGSVSLHNEANLGESMERLVQPLEANTTQNTLRSQSQGTSISPFTSPRRSSNTLVPPERNDFGGYSGFGLSRPPLVDERDLSPQETMRKYVWEGQLTSQSPPATLSPSTSFSPRWDERISRKAISEPDTGSQAQMRGGPRLHRSRERVGGLRDAAQRDEVLPPLPPARYYPQMDGAME